MHVYVYVTRVCPKPNGLVRRYPQSCAVHTHILCLYIVVYIYISVRFPRFSFDRISEQNCTLAWSQNALNVFLYVRFILLPRGIRVRL